MKPNGTKVYPKATGQSLRVDSAGFGGTALHSLNEAKHAQEIKENSLHFTPKTSGNIK
jgi:hypothetical protein